MNRVLVVLAFVLLGFSRASEWNCTIVKRQPIAPDRLFFDSPPTLVDRCTITVEYRLDDNEQTVCTTETLSIPRLPTFLSSSSSMNFTVHTLRIHACQLLTVNQLAFTLPTSLVELDLSANLLSTLSVSFLPLKYLRLDHNPDLIEIDVDEEHLIGLSLRHNPHLQLAALPRRLTQLDLTDCHLSHLTSLPSLTRLTHLSLAANQFVRLPELDSRVQLQYLNLSKNRLTLLSHSWLSSSSLRMLDVRFNQIRSMDVLPARWKNTTKTEHTMGKDVVVQVFLHGNPVQCDCWLGAHLSSASLIHLMDFQTLGCQTQTDLFCSYTRHCASDCFCCEFEACDCHSVCPADCQCSHDGTWSRHRVQCRRADLKSLLPETITELSYEDSHLEQFPSFILIGKTRLVKLNLAKNRLRDLTNETFCAAVNLQELNLSDNLQFRLIKDFFRCLKQLRLLILSKDQIDDQTEISDGWTMALDPDNEKLIRLSRSPILGLSPSVSLSTKPVSNTPRHPHELFTASSSSSSSLFHHNQTLLILVFFLLVFVLLFLILLLALAICRRKLRRHFHAELQRQRVEQQQYYHHHPTSVHQPSIQVTDSHRTMATNDSLYEQLPSLSSDSEQPFLYHEIDKFNHLHPLSPAPPPPPPALPPHPSTFHPSLCCSHDYHCAKHSSMLGDYSTSAHHCPSTMLVWPNHYDCCPARLHHQHPDAQTLENNHRRYCPHARQFHATICRDCHPETYIYSHGHR